MDDHEDVRRLPEEDGALTRIAQRELARRPRDIPSIALILLCVLALFYTLYLTAVVVLPIIFALVLKMLMQPAMRVLAERLHVPAMAAALLMVLSLLGGLGAIGVSIAAPAADWLGKAPTGLTVLEDRLAMIHRPIGAIQAVTKRVEGLASERENTPVLAVEGTGLGGLLFSGTRIVLGGLGTLCVVLFFLLAAGDTFLRRLVEILPTFADKKRAVEIVYEIEQNISSYLVTVTVMNLAVGVATGLAMWACGVSDPALWGVIAFLLNYAPILGPITGVAMFVVVGLMSFASTWLALLPAGAYLAIHVAEGAAITPILLAHRFTLNPVFVVISIFFWYWMWGVPGALLAVPLLGITKIVSDRIAPLTPLGHLLGAASGQRAAAS